MSDDQSNTEVTSPAFEIGASQPAQPGAPPPVYDWSQAPPAQRSYGPPQSQMGGIIPTGNPASLWSYYCGIFSLTVCFSPILSPIAILQGRKALKNIRDTPGLPGKAHALVGIISGTIGFLILLALVLIPVIASTTQP